MRRSWATQDQRSQGMQHSMAIRRYLIPLTLVASTASAAAQDKDKLVLIGEAVFFSCYQCHGLGDTAKFEKHGPHLDELFGRKPGSLPNYEYSEAMIEFGQDKVWDEATLTSFLHDPQAVVAGTKM